MLELFDIWIRSWKQMLVFCVSAVILSVIISMPAIMPPYYESKVIFYPSNPSSSDRNTLFNEDGRSMDYFGGKEDADRLLSIAKSQQLADAIIKKFNLADYYNIHAGPYAVRREFNSNYEAFKNSLGALEISLLDRDPQFGAKLAEEIVYHIDSTNWSMISTFRLKAMQSFEEAYINKEAELVNISDTLSRIKQQHNIIMSTEGFIIKGDNAYAVEQARILQGRQNSLISELSQINRLRGQNAMVTEDRSTTIYVIEKATPAEKKKKPVRWMIVLGTALAALVAATIFAIILDLLERVRSKS